MEPKNDSFDDDDGDVIEAALTLWLLSREFNSNMMMKPNRFFDSGVVGEQQHSASEVLLEQPNKKRKKTAATTATPLKPKTTTDVKLQNRYDGIKRHGSKRVMSIFDGVRVDQLGNNPLVPPIPNLEGRIGMCSEPFSKSIYKSDLDKNLGRLFLNKSKMKTIVAEFGISLQKLRRGIEVKVYDEEGKEFEMTFKSWSQEKYYVLTSGWDKFYKEKGLQLDDILTVWMFNKNSSREVCFALMIASQKVN